jgi:polar amino acid transport system substrate-binding protein
MSIYTFAQGRARRGNASARNAAGRLVQALLVLLTGVSAPWALAQPAGGGYANPQGAVQRQAPTEAAPVPPAPPIDMLATVRNRGSVRVCVAVNEPMVMHDRSGALVGYSIDLAERLAEDLGVKLELVETSWSQIVPDLLGRHCDLVASGLWVSLPRALVVNFTQPAAEQGIYLVAGKSARTRRTAADFNVAGTRIAVYAGTVQEALAARKFPLATLLKVDGDADHLAPVLSGRADAALVPTFAPQLLTQGTPGRLFLPLDRPLASSVTAMAIRKGDADFLSFLNTWLTVHRAEGWLDERALHWSSASGLK